MPTTMITTPTAPNSLLLTPNFTASHAPNPTTMTPTAISLLKAPRPHLSATPKNYSPEMAFIPPPSPTTLPFAATKPRMMTMPYTAPHAPIPKPTTPLSSTASHAPTLMTTMTTATPPTTSLNCSGRCSDDDDSSCADNDGSYAEPTPDATDPPAFPFDSIIQALFPTDAASDATDPSILSTLDIPDDLSFYTQPEPWHKLKPYLDLDLEPTDLEPPDDDDADSWEIPPHLQHPLDTDPDLDNDSEPLPNLTEIDSDSESESEEELPTKHRHHGTGRSLVRLLKKFTPTFRPCRPKKSSTKTTSHPMLKSVRDCIKICFNQL